MALKKKRSRVVRKDKPRPEAWLVNAAKPQVKTKPVPIYLTRSVEEDKAMWKQVFADLGLPDPADVPVEMFREMVKKRNEGGRMKDEEKGQGPRTKAE